MKLQKKLIINLVLLLSNSVAFADWFAWDECFNKDVILEFRAGYFRPTDCVFRNIVDNKAALFGPEVTFHMYRCIYGFTSIDFLTKNGRSLGLQNSTDIFMLPLGIGLKWMEEISNCVTGYVGLGFQPTFLRTKDCSPFVCQKRHKWGFGGIAKAGVYVDWQENWFLDFFVDYSFVKVKPFCCDIPNVQPRKADLSGVIIGGGLGYRFN